MSNTYINKPADQWTAADFRRWATGEAQAGNKAGGEAEVQKAAVALLRLDGVEGETDEQFKGRVVTALQDLENKQGASNTPQPNEGAVEGPGAVNEQAAQAAADEAAQSTELNSQVKPEGLADGVTDDTAIPSDEPESVQLGLSQEEFDGLTTTQKVIVQNLASYAKTMAPNVAHQPGEGAAAQVLLWRTIQTTLRQTGSDFSASFSRLLDFVAEHQKDLFNEYNSHRYFDQLALSKEERKNFERFLYLIVQVSDRGTRQQNLKQVDLQAALKGFTDPGVQQRVTEYFSI